MWDAFLSKEKVGLVERGSLYFGHVGLGLCCCKMLSFGMILIGVLVVAGLAGIEGDEWRGPDGGRG